MTNSFMNETSQLMTNNVSIGNSSVSTGISPGLSTLSGPSACNVTNINNNNNNNKINNNNNNKNNLVINKNSNGSIANSSGVVFVGGGNGMSNNNITNSGSVIVGGGIVNSSGNIIASSSNIPNSISIADDQVREYLTFRGFMESLRIFERECKMDRSKSLQCDKIVEQLFMYLKQYEILKCMDYWHFLENKFFSKLEDEFQETVRKLEQSLKKFYVVNCVQTNRLDRCKEFFEIFGTELIREEEWKEWFILPFIKWNELQNTKLEPFFSKHWSDMLYVSLHNLINTALNSVEKPQLLILQTDKRDRQSVLKRKVNMLMNENQSLKSKLIAAESYIAKLETEAGINRADRSPLSTSSSGSAGNVNSSTIGDWDGAREHTEMTTTDIDATNSPRTLAATNAFPAHNISSDEATSDDYTLKKSPLEKKTSILTSNKPSRIYPPQDYTKLKLLQPKRTFIGHRLPVTQCKFSVDGKYIASSSMDKTVNVCSLNNNKGVSFDCGAPVLCVDWNQKNENLLLSGTNNGKIKVWNVEMSKCVSEATIDAEYHNICDVVSCPNNSYYCIASCANDSAESSVGGKGVVLGYNLKHMKVDNRFPLDPDIAITNILFNHNGTMLLTAANDGMIRIYDVNTQTPIMKWRAHNGCVTSVQFSRNETTILSTGTDNRIVQWSAHHEGRILDELHPDFILPGDHSGNNAYVLPKLSLVEDDGNEMLIYNNPSVVYSMISKKPVYAFSTPTMTTMDCYCHHSNNSIHINEEIYIIGAEPESHNLNLFSFIS
jgi:WD40 repeat protein